METEPVCVLKGMKKLTISTAVGALAVALAACGGSSAKHSASSNVLVNSSGLALYSPTGETATNVRCTGACAAIWKPVAPGTAKLTGAGKLGVITRPDGSKQVTAAGKPLYTFVQDKPGSVSGNGASDAFGGKHFSWHVVTSAGSTGAAPASMPSSGGYSSSGGY